MARRKPGALGSSIAPTSVGLQRLSTYLADPPREACNVSFALAHAFVITSLESTRNTHISQICAPHRGLQCTLSPWVSKDDIDLEEKIQSARGTPLRELLTAANISNAVFNFDSTAGVQPRSKGEYALSLAHRNLYDTVLMNRLPCALILENDFNFHGSLLERALVLSMPDEFDVLRLEVINGKPSPQHKLTPAVLPGKHGLGSAGYIVSYHGAALLRAVQTPVWTASDSAFYALEREFYPPRSRTAFDRFMAAHPARWRPIRAFYTAPPLGWQQDTLERERPLTVGQGGKKDDDPPRCVQWSNDTRPFAYQHIY